MRTPLAVAAILFAAGCNHTTLDKDIIGEWENAGTPISTALPESLRKSADWSAEITFEAGGKFEWLLDNESGTKDRYAGTYKVVGYSLDMTITESDGRNLPASERLTYTLRQQSTGALRLPLPQDWTGPSVDYFKK